ncbi:MAG: hypothetical protein HY875_14835 [Chloroflexi bacterium]|nr:hypothetical protein [Chloroflexota bacterium]
MVFVFGRVPTQFKTAECRGDFSYHYGLRSDTLPAAKAAEQRRLFDGPGRILVRESLQYNCAGLVFAARRGWLTEDQQSEQKEGAADFGRVVLRILEADGLRRRGGGEPVREGDIVLYAHEGTIEHVGCVISRLDPVFRKPMVLSKWGDAGEYLHDIDNVAAHLGAVHSVWTYEDA